MKRLLMFAAAAFILDVYAADTSFTKKIDDDLVEDDDLDEKVDEEFSEELDILEGKSPKKRLLDVLQKAYKLAEEHQKSKKFNNTAKAALKAVYNSTKRAMEVLNKESDADEI